MKTPVIILGTLDDCWLDASASLAATNSTEAQKDFTKLNDELFGQRPYDSRRWTISDCKPAGSAGQRVSEFLARHAVGNRIVVTDPRAIWLVDDFVGHPAKPQFLAYYRRPEDCIAGVPEEGDHRGALEVWLASADRLLDLVRRNRSQVSLLASEECAAEPEAWKDFLRLRYNLESAGKMTTLSPDPVRYTLARMLVQADRKTGALIAELNAASHPLCKEPLPEPDADTLLDGAWKSLYTAKKESAATIAQLRIRCDELADERAASLRERKETEEENELLLLQLHQVQEELENYFLENRRLQKGLLGCAAIAPRALEIGALHLGLSVDTPPHRHLDFTLEEARLPGRPLGNLRLRLVEHHGKAGMMVFNPGAPQAAPILHWRSDGEERGTPYMLVIPQDAAGAQFLEAAPSSDLLLLHDGARLLLDELLGSAGSPHRKYDWVQVVRRFLDQLGEVHARIHYDDIRATSQDGEFTVKLKNAWVPREGLRPDLTLVWREQRIALGRPGENGASDVAMDLASGFGWRPQFAAWGGLDRKTQRLLLLLVAELPNFVHHLIRQNPQLEGRRGSLLRRAAAMRKRAEAISTGGRLGRLRTILPM
jgi:hypothetical protein